MGVSMCAQNNKILQRENVQRKQENVNFCVHRAQNMFSGAKFEITELRGNLYHRGF